MRNIACLLLLISVYACDPTVVFTEPQPEGKKDLMNFPAGSMGAYLELDDSSVYIIESKKILEKHEEVLANSVEEVIQDDDVELTGDQLVMKDLNYSVPVIRRNDSVFGRIVLYDTVFSIPRGDRLRKLGRNYFLSLQRDSLWMVLKLTFDNSGRAYLCDIDYENEMDLIGQYCKMEVKTDEEGNPVKYILSPSTKELKKLLKLEAFSDTTEYIRISQDDSK